MVDSIHLQDSKSSDVVKIVEASSRGLSVTNQSKVAIGYVVKGKKTIYCTGEPRVVEEGSLYFIGEGVHYVENVTTSSHYEEIVFHIPTSVLQAVVMSLAETGEIVIDVSHRCQRCRGHNVVALLSQLGFVDGFFARVNHSIAHGNISTNHVVRNIRIAELIYLILSYEDECLRSVLLRSCDVEYMQFVRIVYDNMFNDISIEELAKIANRSVTSFKKDFQRYFNMPPHHWYIEQRLMRAKILLLSSELTISEIGIMCSFTNISHFIKLFKMYFKYTPAAMRKMFRNKKAEDASDKESILTEE